MWYAITGIYAGALDEERTTSDEDECDRMVQELADVYRGLGTDEEWQVYVLPHHCDPESDGECVCVQYLTDHHPAVSSDEAEVLALDPYSRRV